MAYNDLLSRVCLLLEKKSIRYQLSDANLTNRYRNDTSFDSKISIAIFNTIEIFSSFSSYLKSMEINTNLTKASSLNWIYLIASMCIFGQDLNNKQIYNAFLI